MKRTLLSLGGFLLLVLVYGTLIEPRLLLDDVKFSAFVPHLPEPWAGQKVAVLSDLQVGMWGDNDGMAREAIDDALDEGVAAVLFAGDLVYSPDSATVDRAVSVVRPVTDAGVPLVVVFGNHDFSLMHRSSEADPQVHEYLRARLDEIGATILTNEAVSLTRGGEALWVVGIGSVWAGQSDPERAMETVPDGAPRLVLMHNPTSFRDIPPAEAPLALAGHTHGGQIRLPFLGETRSWLDIVEPGEMVADGWAADSIGRPGNRLYVTRGIGFSGVPVRINCRPELTTITLLPAEGPLPTRGPIVTDD